MANLNNKEIIDIELFSQVELKVAEVLTAEVVEGSEKLLRLTVDAGDQDEGGAPAPRQVLAGIAKAYSPADLIGRQIVIVANLAPRKLMGIESQGMILAAGDEGGPVILGPAGTVTNGSTIR
jgi:methionine--tRNA ligase beta chain